MTLQEAIAAHGRENLTERNGYILDFENELNPFELRKIVYGTGGCGNVQERSF